MKPKPFSALNHFTVPVAIDRSPSLTPQAPRKGARRAFYDPAIKDLVDAAVAAGTGDEAREEWLAVAAAAEKTAAYVPLAETRVQLVAGQRLRNGVVMRPYTGYDLATAGVR